MARVLVVTSSPLFVEGGHLVIARALVPALREHGHEASLWTTPQNRFGRQGAAYLATWLTDLTCDEVGWQVDTVISMRYPSYAARHPHHVCWLNHTMREYYDLWPQWSSGLSPQNRVKESIRRTLIHTADRWLLTKNVRRVFAQSATIQGRLASDLGVRSEVLYPPAPPRDYRCTSRSRGWRRSSAWICWSTPSRCRRRAARDASSRGTAASSSRSAARSGRSASSRGSR